MDKRFYQIEKIIDDWYSFNLKLSVSDIMPHLIFLMEEYRKLVSKSEPHNKE